MIYDYLREDHRFMLALFDRVTETSDRAEKARADLLESLHVHIVPHAKAEENVLYAYLREHKETHDISLEAIEEHRIAERLLKELAATDVTDEHWNAKMEVLRETMQHHFKEEENEMFEKAKQVLSDEQAKEFGERFVEEKKKLQARLEEKDRSQENRS